MAEVNFKNSVYRFTNPVRVFKANDPYYWEVDNIPLKQLEENCLWLKDQVTGALSLSKVKREDLDELRPYVEGNDNVVKVRPGRYSARINDAYNLTQLQRLTQVLGFAVGETNAWNALVTNTAALEALLNRLKSSIANEALNMNGLVERAFTYPIKDSDYAATTYIKVGSPTTSGVTGLSKPLFPISEVLLWGNQSTTIGEYVVKAYSQANPSQGFLPLAIAENHFIKMWRGVARTAVVDVPAELEIEVPPFSDDDYFYYDDNGTKTPITYPQSVTKRIDLLFIYSKPIDTSAVYIPKYVNGQPTKITTPQLGILRGAGLGINFKQKTLVSSELEPESAIDSQGNLKMIPHAGDQMNTNNGFTASSIHGSFPAPDDLLNLAPALSEKLESTSYLLLGQSILPIAYIVVDKNAQVNSGGKFIISNSNLVDIRPFFRTTELAYNERAGIAAAFPALSFANPAVGKAQLDLEVGKAYSDLTAKIRTVTGSKDGLPRIVGAGYVFGGANFGVEGAYMDYLRTVVANANKERLKQELITRWGLPTDVLINDLPDWDISKWCVDGSYDRKGDYPNDYINTHVQIGSPIDFACYSDLAATTRMQGFGTDNINGQENIVNIHFVRKTININRENVPWMKDYIVQANYLNCVPLTTREVGWNSDAAAGAAGLWVEKKYDKFYIYSAWVGADMYPLANSGNKQKKIPGGGYFNTYPTYNREGHWFAGFAVVTNDLMNGTNASPSFPGEAQAAAAIYPSVTFQVIGIPSNYSGFSTDLHSQNPTLKLT